MQMIHSYSVGQGQGQALPLGERHDLHIVSIYSEDVPPTMKFSQKRNEIVVIENSH